MSNTRHGRPNAPITPGGAEEADESTVRDEVCGMHVQAAHAAATARVGGKTYYFCSERCRERFLEHPGWYVPVAP